MKLTDSTIKSTRENSVYLEEGNDVHVDKVTVANGLDWELVQRTIMENMEARAQIERIQSMRGTTEDFLYMAFINLPSKMKSINGKFAPGTCDPKNNNK